MDKLYKAINIAAIIIVNFGRSDFQYFHLGWTLVQFIQEKNQTSEEVS